MIRCHYKIMIYFFLVFFRLHRTIMRRTRSCRRSTTSPVCIIIPGQLSACPAEKLTAGFLPLFSTAAHPPAAPRTNPRAPACSTSDEPPRNRPRPIAETRREWVTRYLKIWWLFLRVLLNQSMPIEAWTTCRRQTLPDPSRKPRQTHVKDGNCDLIFAANWKTCLKDGNFHRIEFFISALRSQDLKDKRTHRQCSELKTFNTRKKRL